jgi:hypothetical protein
MKVRATQTAFHEGRRVRPGDELNVPDTLKASWFVSADSVVAPASPAKAGRKRDTPVALSQIGKEAPAGPIDNLV